LKEGIYQERDKIKRAQAQEKGITLVVVPFWWAGGVERYFIYLLFILLLFS
jgi:hypothetical protein